MIPSTLEGAALLLAFVAPGLLYEQGVERSLGYWRTSLPDRVLRFFIESVLLQTVAAPAAYGVWHRYVRGGFDPPKADLLLYITLLGYVLVPVGLGLVVGSGVRRHPDAWWVRPVFGLDPAPRAWDYLFSSTPTGYIRARLKNDQRWVAGVFAVTSVGSRGGYASSTPEREDIYLPLQLKCDNTTGELELDPSGSPITLQWGILISRADVDVIESQPW